jgi:iron only hydrogenase large subunit-like protein
MKERSDAQEEKPMITACPNSCFNGVSQKYRKQKQDVAKHKNHLNILLYIIPQTQKLHNNDIVYIFWYP